MPTGQQYSSVATQAQLTAGISASNTSCTVNTTSGFPSTPFTGVFDIGTASQEVVDVTNVSGLTLTITRGVDGSAAQSHSNGATFTHSAIGRDLREARSHIDASTSNDASGHAVHGLQSGSSVVGTTDTQTLTNKTLTSPTINSASLASPAITGTVTGAANYNNIVVTTSAVGSVPLTAKGLASQTADLFDVTDNVPNKLLAVGANGATGAGALTVSPTDTAHTSLLVNAPSGLSGVNIVDFQIGGTSEVRIDQFGQVFVEHGALSMSGVSGATTTSRYVGGTNGGPPTSGSFNVGDFVVDTLWGIVWTCVTAGSPGTWRTSGEVLLAFVSTGTVGSVTFSSIPSYFRHLKIRINAKTSWAGGAIDTIFMTFNNITTNNYEWLVQSVTGASAPVNQNASGAPSAWAGLAWGNNFTSQGSGTNEIFIPDYSASTFAKGFTWNGHAGDGGSTHEHVVGGGSLAPGSLLGAINRIDLTTTNANFVSGSTIELYGLS